MLESQTVEFKREYTDDIKYAVIAFANTDGGKIYIGITDDGQACGIADIDSTMLRLTNMLRDTIRPDVTMFTNCSVEQIDNKNVLVLTVQRGTARPYYLHSKGVRPEGVYVRQGASSVPASDAAILQMIKATSGDSYEDERSLNQSLTFEAAETYFAKKKVPFGEVQKRTLGIIKEDGTYSNLGLLLSDQCPHTIKAAFFEGSKKTVFRDRQEFSGSLFKQLEDAYAYLDRFNCIHGEIVGLERIDQRDYPPEAVREVLLNAMVHREYGISSSTLISIFDDRMEFVTIGGLVRSVSFDDIMLGVSALRNPKLANVFYRLKLIEAYGTGIPKINGVYADYDVKPKIQVSSNAFKITLPNTNFSRYIYPTVTAPILQVHEPVRNMREERIIAAIKQNRSISRKEVQALLNLSQASAILILRKMLAEGTIIKDNNGKYSRYILPR